MTNHKSTCDLNYDALAEMLDDAGFFSVTFTKRTDGSERKLCGLRNVKKHLAGGPPAYVPKQKGLMVLWSQTDVGKHGPNDKGYRSFGIDSITSMVVNGQIWINRDGKLVATETLSG